MGKRAEKRRIKQEKKRTRRETKRENRANNGGRGKIGQFFKEAFEGPAKQGLGGLLGGLFGRISQNNDEAVSGAIDGQLKLFFKKHWWKIGAGLLVLFTGIFIAVKGGNSKNSKTSKY